MLESIDISVSIRRQKGERRKAVNPKKNYIKSELWTNPGKVPKASIKEQMRNMSKHANKIFREANGNFFDRDLNRRFRNYDEAE